MPSLLRADIDIRQVSRDIVHPDLPLKAVYSAELIFGMLPDGSTIYFKNRHIEHIQYSKEDFAMFEILSEPLMKYFRKRKPWSE